MDFKLYFQVIVTAIVAVLGWVVAHRFTSARELQNRRRQMRTEKLMEIYLKIERSIGRKITPEVLCDLEDATALLQLLGTQMEIKNTLKAAMSFSRDGKDKNDDLDIQGLVNQLRDSLRKELGLETYTGPIARLRLTYEGFDPRELVSGRKSLPPKIEKVRHGDV
jgi:hypothetical protein